MQAIYNRGAARKKPRCSRNRSSTRSRRSCLHWPATGPLYSSKRGPNRNRACHLVVYDYNERLCVTPTRWLWFCRPVIPVAPSFQRHLEASATEWRDVAFRRLRGQKLGQSQKSDTFQELLLKLKSLWLLGVSKLRATGGPRTNLETSRLKG